MKTIRIKGLALIILTLMIISNNNLLQAAELDQSDSILREQERIEAEKERERLRKNLKKSLEEEEKKKEEISGSVSEDNLKCFDIDEIKLEGANNFSKFAYRKIVKPYLNSCISLPEIGDLISKITGWYVKKGYITTRVYLPEQNLKSGILEIMVIEGEIESIEINKNSESDKRRIAMAFPTDSGEVLYLPDLERGIAGLKYPKSSDANMIIEPGSKTGKSKIKIDTKDSRSYFFNVSYDNLGQESTGEDRIKLEGEWDNALSLNEVITVMSQSTIDPWDSEKRSRVFMGGIAMPYGYWRGNLSFMNSSYLTTSTGGFGLPIETSGDTNKLSLGLEREIIKKRRGALALTGGFEYYDNDSYIFDALNPASTYDLSTLNLGVKGSFYLFDAYFTAEFDHEWGVTFFGAMDDPRNAQDDEPKAQFDKYSLVLSGQKSWNIKGGQLNFTSVAEGQISPDTLYSSKNIIIGDRYSVRGFKNDSLYGNEGYYVQNTLGYGMNLPDVNLGKLSFAKQPYMEIFTGLDGGYTKRNDSDDEIMGWAVGAKGSGDRLSWEITYSEPIKSPAYFEEEKVVYLSLKTRIF